MINKKIESAVIFALIIILLVGGFYAFRKFKKPANTSPNSPQTSSQTPTPQPSPSAATSQISASGLDFPIAEFKQRITKKPFGIYITRENSPIQPERFTGYHTGDDVEYQDVTADVPVYAVLDGRVVLSETASGYGGVFMIEIQLDGAAHTILYGHIRPSSLPKVGQNVSKGEQIGLLGTGYSAETDGERRHLHFAVLPDNRIDIKGYVQNKSELSGWIDPLSLYN